MGYAREAVFEAIREAAFGDIGASYSALGVPITGYPRVIRFVNDTDKQIYFSTDGVTNHLRLAASNYLLIDLATNQVDPQGWYLPKGTQIYVKRVSDAPTSGSAWVEILEGAGSQP